MRLPCLLLLVTLTLFTSTSLYAQRGKRVTTPTRAFVLDPDPTILQLVESVDSLHIISSLLKLEAFRTRHSSTDSLTAAKVWLVSQFQEFGYSDISFHQFSWSTRTLTNIVVTKPGRRYPNKFVLLIGHYDSISETPSSLAPGVNDNGSGIALILEVARILVSKQLDYSVRFICFSAEEQGLVGSQNYVNNVVVPENHDIKLVINVDEIGGYRGNTNTTVKVERDEDNNPSGNNQASAAFTDTLASLTRTYSTLNTAITNAYGSDYMSFEDRGYVITGYYEALATPHYHRSTDNFANVDPQYLSQITRGGLAGVAYFAGVQRKYLTVYHSPQANTQDTSQSIPIQAKVQGSSSLSSAHIVYRTNWNPAAAETTMTHNSTIGDTLVYNGWIRKQPYGTMVSYFLRFVSADSLVATFPQDTTAPIVFSVVPDTIPPSIIHAALGNRTFLDAPYEVRASLTDANEIAAAWVEYRINGGTIFTAAMEQLTATLWRGYVNGTFSPGQQVEYALRARDGSFSANVGSWPSSGWQSFRILNSLVYDFEATNGGFLPANDWQWGTIGTPDIPPLLVGEKVWATNTGGNYSNGTTSLLLTPVIDLHGKTELVLSLFHYYKTEPNNDGGNVTVSVDTGSFQLLTPQDGYPAASIIALGGPGYSGNSFVWKEARFPIASLAEHRVQFKFTFASDLLTVSRGWYIDRMRIEYLDTTTTTIMTGSPDKPLVSELMQNHPNPFNPSTSIRFQVGNTGLVSMRVFDLLGREVATLINKVMTPGEYTVTWDATGLSSGTYFCMLNAANVQNGSESHRQIRKMVLVR